MRFDGVFVANVTLFSQNGEVAWKSQKQLLEDLVGAGIHGLVPCGTTGESPTLTQEERRRLIEMCVEIARPRGLKVIAGCGGNSTAAVLSLVKEAKELGADAALVVTPYYNKPTTRGLVAHYQTLADHGNLPIVLYNVPSRTNICLSVETVTQLFEHENIVGIKEASGQNAQWVGIAERTDLKKKSLMAGDDDALAAIRALGGSGIISASANLIPEQFVKIHALATAGEWEKAFALQKRICPLIKALFAETSPAPLKYALNLKKGFESGLRLPLVPVTSETEMLVKAALGALENTL